MNLRQERKKKAKESKEKETPKPKAKSKPKAKEEKPAKEESKVPRLGGDPKSEDVLKVIDMVRDGNAKAKTELYNALGDLEDNGSPHFEDAKEAIDDYNAMTKKTPKKEEKKESLNTELKEGAKELTSDEKVANLLGSKKD